MKQTMEQKELNLCEILKGHYSKVFYSPLFGDTRVMNISSNENYLNVIPVSNPNAKPTKIYRDGRVNDGGRPMLYPTEIAFKNDDFEASWEAWVEEHNRITYNDVCMDLFREHFYNINIDGDIWRYKSNADKNMRISATSRKQLEKLFAINKLMNVQKWIEKDWQPDWKDATQFKHYIYIKDGDIKIGYIFSYCCNVDVFFSTSENAEQAIEILGEDVIRQALSTDW